MVWVGTPKVETQAQWVTALMSALYSPHGIVHILLYLRWAYILHSIVTRELTRPAKITADCHGDCSQVPRFNAGEISRGCKKTSSSILGLGEGCTS